MSVRFTSLEAYRALIASGKNASQVERVYAALLASGRPMSRRELSVATGIEISSIPRTVADLLRLGLVHELEGEPCPISGNLVRPIALAWPASVQARPEPEPDPEPKAQFDLFGSIARIFERAQ